MACCFLKSSVFCVPKKNMLGGGSQTKGVFLGPSPSMRPCKSTSRACSVLSADFMGQSLNLNDENCSSGDYFSSKTTTNNVSIHAQASLCISNAMQWWKKNMKANMIEIHSAQELVNSLLNAGDSLVVVHFYSPGCGGCKTLHPKICQIAEMYPNAIFLKVNYEELKIMCHALHIHVLPFFRFYRGAEGRVSGFSCTNATIKKFKVVLSKHGNERCSLGPAKGLDETELKNLVSAGEISVNSPLRYPNERKLEDLILGNHDFSGIWSMEDYSRRLMQNLKC